MLDLSGKKPRLLQIHHAYSHKYFDTKIAPFVKDGYAAYKSGLPSDAKPESELTFTNRLLISKFNQESPEVKAECEAYRRELQVMGKSAKDGRSALNSQDRSASVDSDGSNSGGDSAHTLEEHRLALIAQIQR